MSEYFIIGNGNSRKSFDLNSLRGKGITVGCNAIIDSFTPDVLVSVDHRMIQEILDKKYKGLFFHPDRKSGELVSSDGYHRYMFFGEAAGPTAVRLVTQRFDKDVQTIYLLGFDFNTDHVYLGRKNYEKEKYKTFKPDNWLNSFKRIFMVYSNINFIRVISEEDQTMSMFFKYGNYSELSMESFQLYITSLKEDK